MKNIHWLIIFLLAVILLVVLFIHAKKEVFIGAACAVGGYIICLNRKQIWGFVTGKFKK